MLKKILCILFISVISSPLVTQASFYTISLKNGNHISVENYWDLESKILYYTNEGSVELPKTIIKNISTAEGNLEPEIGFYPTDDYFDQLQEAKRKEDLLSTELDEEPDSAGLKDKELTDDIRDRISIMDINIENLKKNKDIYNSQKQKFISQKMKIEERIQNYKNDTYTDAEIINSKIKRLNQDTEKLDNNISAVKAKIKQTENLLIRQKNMRIRLQKQLAANK